MKSLVLVIGMMLPLGCKDEGIPPEQHQAAIQLTMLDVGTVDATLKIHLDAAAQSRQVLLKRDGTTVYTLTPTIADTVVVDPPLGPELRPSTSYTYKAYLLSGETEVDSSDALMVTTGDSSSHAIQWRTDTIGTGYSYLKDVAVISDSNIWAVGELYQRDSVGQIDPVQYNLARWDGIRWNVSRIHFPAFCGQQSTYPFTTYAIHALGPNDIWIANAAMVARWNGNTFTILCIPPNLLYGQINKIWISGANSLYAVGNNGTVVYYDGSGWQRQETGTNVHLTDIWGTVDGREVWACGFNDSNGGSVVLRQVNGVWQILWDRLAPSRPPYIYSSYLSSLWSSGSGEFVAVGGRFYRHSLHNLDIVRNEYISTQNGFSIFQMGNWAYRVRGTQKKDIWLVGDDAMIWHWNGSTWHRYDELLDSNVSLYSLAVSEHQVVAVGVKYSGIFHNGLVIRGRR